jgi:hypothetical protein
VFVQLSVLKDYPAALLNRGQDGLAKRASYGNEDRRRISSQCQKAGLCSDQPLITVVDGVEIAGDISGKPG